MDGWCWCCWDLDPATGVNAGEGAVLLDELVISTSGDPSSSLLPAVVDAAGGGYWLSGRSDGDCMTVGSNAIMVVSVSSPAPRRAALSWLTQSSRYLTYSMEACRIANLCISPVQAGIKFFNTANSSFIFDRRRRSMRLCAVFLAIFLPAALVADGCFLLLAPAADAVVVVVVAVDFDAEAAAAAVLLFEAAVSGFIWMILRERVGGGGRTKVAVSSLACCCWWCC